MSYTSTSTYTRTHTATHLTDVIMGTIADVLGSLNIDVTALYRDWDQDESAIQAWILEGSLTAVVLECHQPDGTVSPVFEFPVTYTGGVGNAEFTASRARVARFLAKLNSVPRGTVQKIFCTFDGPHSDQPGWSPGKRASVEGLQSLTYGTLGAAPDASASMRYLYK